MPGGYNCLCVKEVLYDFCAKLPLCQLYISYSHHDPEIKESSSVEGHKKYLHHIFCKNTQPYLYFFV